MLRIILDGTLVPEGRKKIFFRVMLGRRGGLVLPSTSPTSNINQLTHPLSLY